MFLQLSLQRRGGGAEDAWHFSEALVKLGFVHQVMVARGNEREHDFTGCAGRVVHKVTTYPSTLRGMIFYTLTLFRPLHWLVQISQLRPKIIYATHFHPWLLFLSLLKKIIPFTFIYAVHEDPYSTKEVSSSFFRQIERIVFKSADAIVVHSQYIARAVKPYLHGRKIHVLLLGAYTDACPSLKPIFSLEDSPLRIVFFGRLEEYKGLDLLLCAFEILKKKQVNAILTLCGQGELTAVFLHKAHELGVVIDQRWIPSEEVCAIFGRTDVLILPYTAASQSGVVSLGLGVGLPLIVTNVGGLPEYVEDGVNGFVVAPDPEALARSVEKYVHDRTLLPRHGAESARRGREVVSWEIGARSLLEFVKSFDTESLSIQKTKHS